MSVLLKPRWLLLHAIVLVVAVAFTNFGFWQLRRLERRTGSNELIEARLESAPAPFEQISAAFDLTAPAPLEASAIYRRAVVRGRFDPEHEVLLRARSYRGEPGWHVLTPLVMESGSAILIDRGWVPYRLDTPPITEATPPDEMVTVTGMILAEQDPPTGSLARLAPRDPPEGELKAAYYADADRLAAQMPYPLEPVYLELIAQEPAQIGDLPVAPPPPEFSRGPHLGYAMQWFSFTLIAVVGYGILIRRALLERDEKEAARA